LPELPSNCIRLEALVHICPTIGNSLRKPRDYLVEKLFSKIGKGRVRSQEDPAEDLLISLIWSPRANFRMPWSTSEAAGFYLQRVVKALELAPERELLDHLRHVIYALLKLPSGTPQRV
jgi:hypothetical protein